MILRKLRRLYLTLRYRRIWTKLAAILLIAVNVPVVILSFLLIDKSRQAVKNSVFNNHAAIADRIADEVGAFVRMPQEVLRATSLNLAAFSADPWKQETILVNQVLNYQFFLRIVCLDAEGKLVASSGMDSRLPEPVAEFLPKVLEGQTYVSGVKDIDTHSPRITIALPISRLGKVNGMLVGEVNLRALWHIMDAITLEKTGNAFIVSEKGLLIAAKDKKKILSRARLIDSDDVRRALSGKKGSMDLDSNGTRWISSYAPVRGLGWAVVLRQEQSEALAFSDRMQQQSLVILFFTELFVVALSVILAQRLARPLRSIIARFRDVADGNLDTRVAEKRFDEFGTLFKSFNVMIEKLKKTKEMERFSVIGQASACITHEFKNSMLALKSFVQLFPTQHNDEEFVETFGKLVPEEMKRWERMFKELSEFSSVDELVKAQMSMGPVVESVLKMLAQDFAAHGIRVAYFGKNDVVLNADKGRLKQVIMNIVINAVQAMPAGGDLEIIEEVVRKESSYAVPQFRVRIRDTGKGIRPEDLPMIFEPFHSNKTGSLGLGLTISRRIIENHGGTIRVESVPGVGTTFIICLPLPKIFPISLESVI